MRDIQLVLILVLLTGCQEKARANPQPNAAPAGSVALEVVLAAPAARKTMTLNSAQPAQLVPIAQAPIHSKLSAYVDEVLVDYGDVVEADQPLVTLRVPELQQEMKQREALLAAAVAARRQAESAIKAAEAAVATAQSQRAEAEAGVSRSAADVRRWQSELSRFERLSAEGAIDRKLVDEAQQKSQAAQSSEREAKAHAASALALIAEAEAKIAQRQADVVATEAAIQVAQANLDLSRTMLDYAVLKSPFSGVITQRHVDPGHYVEPNRASSPPLLTVMKTDTIRVLVSVPEAESGMVDEGDEAVIEIQALANAAFRGQVSRTSVSLDRENRALLAIVDLPNPDGRLRAGMYALAKLKLEERPDVLVIPSAAITRQAADVFCFRFIDGHAVRTPIQLGLRVGDEYEVVSGLSPDDTVILNKAANLQDGQAVSVTKPAEKK